MIELLQKYCKTRQVIKDKGSYIFELFPDELIIWEIKIGKLRKKKTDGGCYIVKISKKRLIKEAKDFFDSQVRD